MGRRAPNDKLRTFFFPVHKLFPGKNCIAGATIKLAFQEYHRNDKLQRVHKSGGIKAIKGFDLDEPPFVRDSQKSRDLVTLRKEGASVLVVPQQFGVLVRTAKQMNTSTKKNEIARFVVPKENGNRYETSYLIEADPSGARKAPEYVNIRHRVVPKGAGFAIEDMQSLPDNEFKDLLEVGKYEAAHFIDDTSDGAVTAVVDGLPGKPRNLAAYSLVTAPDFFPLSDHSGDARYAGPANTLA
jgi:hypothetical protein